eukprot:g1209.t1
MSGDDSSSDKDLMDMSLREELDLSHELVEEYEHQFTEMESERDALLETVKLRESEVVELKRRLSMGSMATSGEQLPSSDGNSHVNQLSEGEQEMTSEKLLAHPLVKELRERFAFVSAENKRLRVEVKELRDKAEKAGSFLAEKTEVPSVSEAKNSQEQLLEAECSKNAILLSEVEALKLAMVKLKEEHTMKIVNLTKVFERIAEASNVAADTRTPSITETNTNVAAESLSSSSSETNNDEEIDGVEKDVPDFMVRRIFDTVDEDRHGEISAKQLSLWLSKDSGALTEGENSQIIQKIRDIENKDDANPGGNPRQSALEREMLLNSAHFLQSFIVRKMPAHVEDMMVDFSMNNILDTSI